MKEYTVKWQIEVTADNPTEAAMQARMIMLDPESEAVHFEVQNFLDGSDPTIWKPVDLSEVDFTEVEV